MPVGYHDTNTGFMDELHVRKIMVKANVKVVERAIERLAKMQLNYTRDMCIVEEMR